MAIEDSLPERRNLSVLSLAFIAYYYAGGSVSSNELQLEVINITFARGGVLAAMAWTMLGWFTIRYWQATRGAFSARFHDEMQRNCNTQAVRGYLEGHYKRQPNDNRTGFTGTGFGGSKGARTISFVASADGGAIESMNLEGPSGVRAYRSIVARTVLVGNAVTTLLPAYLLALLAALGPVARSFLGP